MLWDQFVDLLRLTIVAYAQACGGNLGAGILAFSVMVRIVMFPVTLRVARAAQAHRQAMQKLHPELERIRKRFAGQPERIAEESQKLFKEKGVSPVPYTGCLGGLAQVPVFLAVYSAVRQAVVAGGRFLWIGNIARPDMILTIVVTALTCASLAYSTSELPQQGRSVAVLFPVVATFLILARTSAGLGLYWGVSAAASLVQTMVIGRSAPSQAAA